MSYSINPESEENKSGVGTDPAKLEQLMREKHAERSMPLAIIAGFAASLIAAVLWAAITYVTNYQIGFMAIGVGFLVGYAVNYFGKGFSLSFGIVGAAFALFGCLAGNLLTSFIVLSQLEESSAAIVLFAVLASPGIIVDVMRETFSPIDLLFYAIAIYESYKLSFNNPTEEELANIQIKPNTV